MYMPRTWNLQVNETLQTRCIKPYMRHRSDIGTTLIRYLCLLEHSFLESTKAIDSSSVLVACLILTDQAVAFLDVQVYMRPRRYAKYSFNNVESNQTFLQTNG